MNYSSKNKQILLACIASLFLVALTACGKPILDQRGYLFEKEKLARISNGMPQSQFSTIMGTPSMISTDNKIWYYVSISYVTEEYRAPKETKRKIMAFVFDDANTLIQQVEYGKEDAQKIALAQQVTPTRGKELGVWEQLLGNLGRFNNQSTSGLGNDNIER